MLAEINENTLTNKNMLQINSNSNAITLRKKMRLNSGRWKQIEHEKFLEAIIMYGNDWKCVDKFIKTRSSTQARSHAQKFLLKLKKKLKIQPTIDNLNSSPRLSNESIQKIINEIVQNSSMRNSQYDREKLVKLIMGFSNLLIGKCKEPSQFGDSSNDSFKNYSMNKFQFQNDPNSRNTFNIQKINKSGRESLSNNNSSLDTSFYSRHNSHNPFHIEKKEKKESKFNTSEFGSNNLQITNQDELLKLLLQQQNVQDPLNLNKNFINIISINIVKNNETFINNDNLQTNLNKMNVNNLMNNTDSSQDIACAESVLYVNNNNNLNHNNSLSNNSSAIEIASPAYNRTSCYEHDFYENSSLIFNYKQKNVDDEVDRFFNW